MARRGEPEGPDQGRDPHVPAAPQDGRAQAGHPAAYELAFDVGNRLFAYNASFREDVANASPGNVVTAELIRDGAARGRVEYDMLRGDEPYKLRWSDQRRSEVQVLVAAPRMRARLCTMLGPRLRTRLRRIDWLVELDDRISGARNRGRA